MFNYLVKFTRYNNGETRISGAQFINADDFDDAFEIAKDRVRGMIAADPQSKFYIERIEARGVRGTDCEGGCYPFETADEFSARVTPQPAAEANQA